jgi:hypothetical protein
MGYRSYQFAKSGKGIKQQTLDAPPENSNDAVTNQKEKPNE